MKAGEHKIKTLYTINIHSQSAAGTLSVPPPKFPIEPAFPIDSPPSYDAVIGEQPTASDSGAFVWEFDEFYWTRGVFSLFLPHPPSSITDMRLL